MVGAHALSAFGRWADGVCEALWPVMTVFRFITPKVRGPYLPSGINAGKSACRSLDSHPPPPPRRLQHLAWHSHYQGKPNTNLISQPFVAASELLARGPVWTSAPPQSLLVPHGPRSSVSRYDVLRVRQNGI